jgi:AAA+ superfamily predicted ATPase
MARSDLIVKIVESSLGGNRERLRRAVEAIIAEERSQQHNVFADRLEALLKQTETAPTKPVGSTTPTIFASGNQLSDMVYELSPRIRFEDLILSPDVLATCRDLVEEQHRSELLSSFNLMPRNRVLLSGSPGTGKTSLSEAIAQSLMVPLYVVRYEALITSYLGETAQRLRVLFDAVRKQRCVLFFDEFDAIAKERGDLHETGEIKRLVTSLLLQTDSLPSYTVLVAATNHQELLDRAVWRRFQICLNLPLPGNSEILDWIIRFQGRLGQPLAIRPALLANRLKGANFAELEELGTALLRRKALADPSADLDSLFSQTLRAWSLRRRATRPGKHPNA